MTYAELKEKLEGLTPEQLQCNVTVYSWDYEEVLPAGLFINDGELDTLDEGHPVISI